MKQKCFACGRALGRNPALVDTRDAQTVFVGSECYKHIKRAGEAGWVPPSGGLRLWPLTPGLSQAEIAQKRQAARRRK